jgi:hypothetical protein
MTEQQERRPFLGLTDHELELILTALFSEAARASVSLTLEYNRIAEVVWQELRRRGAPKPTAETAQCQTLAAYYPPFGPLRCKGILGHDGPHFVINKYDERREWQ